MTSRIRTPQREVPILEKGVHAIHLRMEAIQCYHSYRKRMEIPMMVICGASVLARHLVAHQGQRMGRHVVAIHRHDREDAIPHHDRRDQHRETNHFPDRVAGHVLEMELQSNDARQADEMVVAAEMEATFGGQKVPLRHSARQEGAPSLLLVKQLHIQASKTRTKRLRMQPTFKLRASNKASADGKCQLQPSNPEESTGSSFLWQGLGISALLAWRLRPGHWQPQARASG